MNVAGVKFDLTNYNIGRKGRKRKRGLEALLREYIDFSKLTESDKLILALNGYFFDEAGNPTLPDPTVETDSIVVDPDSDGLNNESVY